MRNSRFSKTRRSPRTRFGLVALAVLVTASAVPGQTKFKERGTDRTCSVYDYRPIVDPIRGPFLELEATKSGRTPCLVGLGDALTSRKGDEPGRTVDREGFPYFKTNGEQSDVRSPRREKEPQAQADDSQELAQKLSNPISSLISFPFQNNFDFGMGPERKGFRYTLNIQPVIPFALSKDVNVISRTILPVIAQDDVVGSSGQGGLGDTVQSFFFSPSKSEPFIWGVGPQILIPTATNEFLGSQKFGMGPTIVALKQQKGWTYGALVSHTWSVFGKDSRLPVNSTFLQPFLSYTTKNAWSFTFNTESAYDWTGDAWNVPIHFQVSKLMTMGKQPVSVGIASRCWAVSGPGGPQGCGFRLLFVPLFPVK